MKNLIALMIVLFSLNAFAEREGGGGTVVICRGVNMKLLAPEDPIKWIQVYDFWNANQEYNLTVPIDDETPYMEQIERNMKRLEKLDPLLANYVRKKAKFFAPDVINKNEEVGFVSNIIDNGDGKYMIKPDEGPGAECYKLELQRMAFFKDEPKFRERKFLLVKDLWDVAGEHAHNI